MTPAGPDTRGSGRSIGPARSAPSRRRSTSSANGCERPPGDARLPLQPLRADLGRSALGAARDARGGRRPADGPLRHAGGRGRRPVPPGVFVDLYRVVRQGIRASVESYSIKRLEPFCGYERAVDLPEVNEQMVLFEVGLDDATAAADTSAQELIAGYNEDDCRATLALRDWLETLRLDLESQLGRALPRLVGSRQRARADEHRSRRSRTSARGCSPGCQRTRRRSRENGLGRSWRTCSSGIAGRTSRGGGVVPPAPAERRGTPPRSRTRSRDSSIERTRRRGRKIEPRRFRFPAQEHPLRGRRCTGRPDRRDRACWTIDDVDDHARGARAQTRPDTADDPHPTCLIERRSGYNTDSIARGSASWRSESRSRRRDRGPRDCGLRPAAAAAAEHRRRASRAAPPARRGRRRGRPTARAEARSLVPPDPGAARHRQDLHGRQSDPRARGGAGGRSASRPRRTR